MAEVAREAQQAAGVDDGLDLRVEFEGFPDIGLAFERLARERSGIEFFETIAITGARQVGDNRFRCSGL